MEIPFCSHPNTNEVVATQFGTWHDSWAVVAFAKFCSNMITSNWIRTKWNFHWIWIVMEKLLVKLVPDAYMRHSDSTFETDRVFSNWIKYNCFWHARLRIFTEYTVHPFWKVIGIYFVVSNDGIYFQCIDLKYFMMMHDEVFCINCGKYHQCMLLRRACVKPETQ